MIEAWLLPVGFMGDGGDEDENIPLVLRILGYMQLHTRGRACLPGSRGACQLFMRLPRRPVMEILCTYGDCLRSHFLPIYKASRLETTSPCPAHGDEGYSGMGLPGYPTAPAHMATRQHRLPWLPDSIGLPSMDVATPTSPCGGHCYTSALTAAVHPTSRSPSGARWSALIGESAAGVPCPLGLETCGGGGVAV